jgi:preprotein translocase subunit SecB
LNAQPVSDDVHEVSIKIEVTARSDNGVHFVVDLTYAGLIGIRNMPQEAVPPILLVEAPRLIFPFARQIIADAIINTGFPPLLLDPIDFASAYVAQLQAAQQQAPEDGAGGEPEGGTEGGGEAPTETPSES